MTWADFFSSDYRTARERFLAAARHLAAEVRSYPFPQPSSAAQELCVDVATLGEIDAPHTLVISSGLHGAEGYFGSAVQLAMLDRWGHVPPPLEKLRIVLIHALNPWGFAERRRFNENNVDLNRNFLLAGEEYRGSPPLYATLDRWLNAPHPPRFLPLPPLGCIADFLRYGAAKLQATIPAGQYDFPKGLFFGGQEPQWTNRLLSENLAEWLGSAEHVIHLDFHTALGPWGTYKLLLDDPLSHPTSAWFVEYFGREFVSPPYESSEKAEATPYDAHGALGTWCVQQFAERQYCFATAEFGTYAPWRVLLALRAENQAQHYTPADDPRRERAKQSLVEAFSPKSHEWRDRVVTQGIGLIERAMQATR